MDKNKDHHIFDRHRPAWKMLKAALLLLLVGPVSTVVAASQNKVPLHGADQDGDGEAWRVSKTTYGYAETALSSSSRRLQGSKQGPRQVCKKKCLNSKRWFLNKKCIPNCTRAAKNKIKKKKNWKKKVAAACRNGCQRTAKAMYNKCTKGCPAKGEKPEEKFPFNVTGSEARKKLVSDDSGGLDGFDGVIHNEDTTLQLAAITGLTAVYGTANCPGGHSLLSPQYQDLNQYTNGKPVFLCYERGNSARVPINDVAFVTSKGRAWPTCPDDDGGWEPVKTCSNGDGSECQVADLNSGAKVKVFFWTVERKIVMCYHRGSSDRIYHFRILNALEKEPRMFIKDPQNLNQDVSLIPFYMSYSRSNSMLAGAMALAEPFIPMYRLDWVNAVEDASVGKIEVTITVDFQKDGGSSPSCFGGESGGQVIGFGGNTPLNSSEYDRLRELARNGIEDYWSGPLTLHNVTRDLKIKVVAPSIGSNKDADICNRGAKYCDGSSYIRSYNFGELDPLLPMTLWFNRGAYCGDREYGDREFHWASAHEMGHSFLMAYGGFWHSINHKGTSTIWDVSDQTPICPDQPEPVDLMKYYIGGCTRDFDRVRATNWDRAKVLMGAGQAV